MKDFICDNFNSLSYTCGDSKMNNSLSRSWGNVASCPGYSHSLFPYAMHSLQFHSQLAWRQQTLLLRKYHPSSESNFFRDFFHRKQSYCLILNRDQDKLWQISRGSVNTYVSHVVSCPAGPWLMKEQTSRLMRHMNFTPWFL